MFSGHYPPLLIAYLVALGGWMLACRLMPQVWPAASNRVSFAHPWREFGFALLAAVGVLVLGQVWTKGIRLPEKGALGPLFGAVNQALIFAPILVLPWLRRQPWTTAWLPRSKPLVRLVAGLVLAAVAVTAYSLLRRGAADPLHMLSRIWRYDHLDEMVQVFLEDVAIAILFVRLAAAISTRWAAVAVACLFAAGHLPAMFSPGATWPEAGSLVLDAGLGVAAILVLQRSRDILWFWCIHFCLDMTQFPKVTGLG